MADGTSTSLACSPDNAPIQFHWYPADHGQTLAQCLTNVLIDDGVTNLEVLAMVRKEFRQRISNYCDARLTDVEDVRTISRNPKYQLFEIRVKIKGIGLFRL